MHDNKKYKQMLIYLATDYAATMISPTLDIPGVFVMTATDYKET